MLPRLSLAGAQDKIAVYEAHGGTGCPCAPESSGNLGSAPPQCSVCAIVMPTRTPGTQYTSWRPNLYLGYLFNFTLIARHCSYCAVFLGSASTKPCSQNRNQSKFRS